MIHHLGRSGDISGRSASMASKRDVTISAPRTVLVSAAVCLSVAACASGIVPSSQPPANGSSTPSPSEAVRGSPVPDGCGATNFFGPPGPTDIPGLGGLTWAPVEPESSTVVAYFWGHPPYLAAGNTRPDGQSNKVLWITQRGGHALSIRANPTNGGQAVGFEFSADAGESGNAQFPSAIDLPSPGCWHLDLKFSNDVSGSIDVLVAPAPG
jgi:hypothetical protein